MRTPPIPTRSWCSVASAVKPARCIPGPRSWPLVGTAWTYLPRIGRDDVHALHKVYLDKYRKYGKIVRENIAGKELVSVYDPVDIETVFRNEGRYPTRLSHEVLLAIRHRSPEIYRSGGMVPANGEEWSRLRRGYQQEVNRVEVLVDYLPNLEATSREFNDYLKSSRTADGLVPDLLYKMHEWALENVCVNVLDARLDDFKANRNPLCRELISGANEGLLALGRCEYFPTWRLYESADYRTIRTVDLLFYRVARTYVEKKRRALEDGHGASRSAGGPSTHVSVLEKYLTNPKNDPLDVITVASELLFTGLLTTAVSASFILYHLSRNPRKQEVLFREVKRCLPEGDRPVTAECLDAMTYLKACVKETLRMNPVALGTSRVLPNDVVLSGYRIPAGTSVLTQNQVAGNLAEYVEDPSDFSPERWMRDVDGGPKRPHPYLVLPFGTGPRGCVGRRFAELETYVFLALFVRRFRIEWKGEKDVDVETQMINIPVGSMDIRIVDRDEE